jgi:hypothetical protein
MRVIMTGLIARIRADFQPLNPGVPERDERARRLGLLWSPPSG